VFRAHFSDALGVDPESKPRLYGQIYASAEFASASYILDLLFAAAIATLGLVLNSPAVVIGAMLISPLMGPILAAGLAFAASDIYLGVKSFLSLIGSILASIAFSGLLVWLLPFQSPTSEILARTHPNLLDLGVAIFSGLAGSVVMSRSLSGAGSALPGVAIAVALMPPLCTVGFGVGSGWNWQIISGAGLLFLTNLVAIAASAFLVFYLVGMDAPEIRGSVSEAARRHATGNRLYAIFHDSALGKLFGEAGLLRWRILMVVVTIAVLFIPLKSSLMQLRDETLSRAAARETIRTLVPADDLLSQSLEILPDRLIQRVVTTSAPDPTRITFAEAELTRRTGKHAVIQVRQVANEEELVVLRETLRAPDTPAPPPTLRAMGATILPLIEEPLKTIWPAGTALLVSSEVGFTKEGTLIRMGYHAPRAFDAPAQETIRNALRHALKVDNLVTVFDWRGPVKPNPPQKK
jgi:uncharacterized hydrophobic protein (TIGR00271 family)